MKTDNILYIFSGCTGCGKTSISKPFAESNGFRWTSFGNAVRAEAGRLGLRADDKAVLQSLGQKLVENEPERLCEIVLHDLKAANRGAGVLDGLRHMRVLELLKLREGADICRVIFVDVEPSIRHLRLKQNRGWSEEECQRYDRDATEVEVNDLLRPAADLVIDNNGSLHSSFAQLEQWRASTF